MYCKVPNNTYLCTQKIKDHAPAFGLTRTFSFVRRCFAHCTQKIKGRVPAFGLTRTFSFVRRCFALAIRN